MFYMAKQTSFRASVLTVSVMRYQRAQENV